MNRRITRSCMGLASLALIAGGVTGQTISRASVSSAGAEANAHTPIFMAHGDEDDVVPMARGLQARDLLVELGHAVSWHTYPMDHTLCLDEIRAVDRWIGALAAPAPDGSI